MNLKAVSNLLAEAFSKCNEHKAIRPVAALAYFGIFAIAPVLIILEVVCWTKVCAGISHP